MNIKSSYLNRDKDSISPKNAKGLLKDAEEKNKYGSAFKKKAHTIVFDEKMDDISKIGNKNKTIQSKNINTKSSRYKKTVVRGFKSQNELVDKKKEKKIEKHVMNTSIM